MLKVELESFNYPNHPELLHQINFELAAGNHLAVLGESGSGKSTLLHLIYGLLDLDKGSITWKGKPILGPKHQLVPGAPFMKLVAQEDNVMPYTTVAENITEFLPRLNLKEDFERAKELMRLVDLEDFAQTKVKKLSGGQKQRVAIAKALAKEPEVLLLDEPFSHIDEFRRSRLRRRLYRHLKEKNISCITATHDANEALSFAHKVLIIENGTVSFYGTPKEWYNNIGSAYQAGFFGEINEFKQADGTVRYIFPHQLVLANSSTNIHVEIVQCFFKGSHYLTQADWDGITLFFNHPEALYPKQRVHLKILKEN